MVVGTVDVFVDVDLTVQVDGLKPALVQHRFVETVAGRGFVRVWPEGRRSLHSVLGLARDVRSLDSVGDSIQLFRLVEKTCVPNE